MKTIIILIAAALIAGCSSHTTKPQFTSTVAGPSDLAITTAFAPDPPQKGADTLTVTLKDSTGAPVKGATVKVATTMPAMNMMGPAVTAHDNGDGTYTAALLLQYATSWQFAITAESNGKSGTAQRTADVQ